MTARDYDSPFGKAYQHYVVHRTSSAPLYQRFAAAALCAGALGNRVFAEVGWGRVYPCLWVGFIGPSRMRKTTAVNLACDLLTEAVPEIEFPHDFSRESFYDRLRRQPAGLLRWREMGSVLEVWNLDYMGGISATFADFWDSPAKTVRELRPKGTKEPERIIIERPAVTIIAGAKLHWFLENVKKRDLKGGFLGRWLFVVPDEPGERRPFIGTKSSEDGIARESMVDLLRDLSQVSGRVDVSEVRTYLNKWVDDFERWLEKKGDEYDPAEFGGRAGTQVLKLAMAIQAGYGADSALVLSQDAVASAIGLWNIAFQHNLALVDQIGKMGQTSEKLDKLDKSMSRHNGKVTQRDLLRDTGYLLKELMPLVDYKLAAKAWIREKVEREGKRPSIVYRCANGEDQEDEEEEA